jgi:hypothetical protein
LARNLYNLLDAVPNPWNWRFLSVGVAASVIATMVACLRDSSSGMVAGLVVLAVSVLVVVFGRRLLTSTSIASNRVMRLIIAPLLLGIPSLLTAIVMGHPGAGGYPAALIILLAVAVITTRDVEKQARVASDGREDFPVHTAYRGALAWVSTVFFFFGVATLWPWLGQLYGGGYFWILVLGVLFPTLYLWGRLRQPRQHPSMVALTRFNRLLPYIGIILLVAILVG